MNKKIYGIRICRNCKGICHENSYQEKYGTRKGYYCCRRHLESLIKDKYPTISETEMNDHINRMYTLVDVMTA